MPALHQLSVVLPVLNERDNLAELIPELFAVLTPVLDELELIVVDDSSTDGTDNLMAELARSDERIRYISRLGLARSLPDSLSDGVRAARFPHVAWMDADWSMTPKSLRNLIHHYRMAHPANPIIVGSRFIEGGGVKGTNADRRTSLLQLIRNIRKSSESLFAVTLSFLLNQFLWLILGRCCRDLASGFVIAPRTTVLKIGLNGVYGDYCVRFLYLAYVSQIPIIEVPYVINVRQHGYSKTGTHPVDLFRSGLPYLLLGLKLRLGCVS